MTSIQVVELIQDLRSGARLFSYAIESLFVRVVYVFLKLAYQIVVYRRQLLVRQPNWIINLLLECLKWNWDFVIRYLLSQDLLCHLFAELSCVDDQIGLG